ARLIPLYYLVTLIYAIVLVLGPRGYAGNAGIALLTSLAFIPYPTYGVEGSDVFPLFTLGWSLNYEVFFYLLFSIFITAPRSRAVISIAGMLVAVTLAGQLLHPNGIALRFWCQPIILEFGFGMIIALVWRGAIRASLWLCAVVAVVALGLLLADPYMLL